ALEQRLAGSEVEAPAGLFAAVALDAMFDQQGTDVSGERLGAACQPLGVIRRQLLLGGGGGGQKEGQERDGGGRRSGRQGAAPRREGQGAILTVYPMAPRVARLSPAF